MKCPMCGWIVRKVNGAAVAHPCNPKKAPGRRRVVREKVASREEQRARYLDCGPAAWDDR